MDAETATPKTGVLEDNARKFISAPIAANFLKENNARSFLLVTDWVTMNENRETKVVLKQPDGKDPHYLLISKITTNGDRLSEKKIITKAEYEEIVLSSVAHLEKRRFEFTHTQNSTEFIIKYDVFTDGRQPIVEVDATNEEERLKFNLVQFPFKLTEVTGDVRYYGFRAAVT